MEEVKKKRTNWGNKQRRCSPAEREFLDFIEQYKGWEIVDKAVSRGIGAFDRGSYRAVQLEGVSGKELEEILIGQSILEIFSIRWQNLWNDAK